METGRRHKTACHDLSTVAPYQGGKRKNGDTRTRRFRQKTDLELQESREYTVKLP
ncbi:MAG: hypothetical protein ACYS19_03265 [Planctomycetota bacterium]